MAQTEGEYKSYGIRSSLIDLIVPYVETGRYVSVSEFIKEAIRLRLDELVRLGAAEVANA